MRGPEKFHPASPGQLDLPGKDPTRRAESCGLLCACKRPDLYVHKKNCGANARIGGFEHGEIRRLSGHEYSTKRHDER